MAQKFAAYRLGTSAPGQGQNVTGQGQNVMSASGERAGQEARA